MLRTTCTISVKMIGPVTQVTDLQIVCVFKHKPGGDMLIEAMAGLQRQARPLALRSARPR